MDRTLKVFSPTQHLFAEITFHYDLPRQATAHCTQYQPLSPTDEDDDSKSVYPLFDTDWHLQFRQFETIDQIKAHDQELVQQKLGHDMTDPKSYSYAYDPTPVLLRYVAQNHRGCEGMVNVLFSFADNTKEVRFLSGAHPRFDFELSSNSLETNLDCILRIPVYRLRQEPGQLSPHDLQRLEPWY